MIDLIVATIARLDCAPVVSPRARLERSSEMSAVGHGVVDDARERNANGDANVHRRSHCVDCEEGAVAIERRRRRITRARRCAAGGRR